MKNLVRFLTLIISLATLPTTSFGEPAALLPSDVSGTPPPKWVKSWTRLSVLGNVNHPFLIVWISPQTFVRHGFERLVTLSPREYDSLVMFTHSQGCSNIINKPPEQGTLWVTQFSEGRSRSVCVLPPSNACPFMSEVAKLSSVNWTEKRSAPIRDIAADIGCSEGRK